jgi:hypothetical protein
MRRDGFWVWRLFWVEFDCILGNFTVCLTFGGWFDIFEDWSAALVMNQFVFKSVSQNSDENYDFKPRPT